MNSNRDGLRFKPGKVLHFFPTRRNSRSVVLEVHLREQPVGHERLTSLFVHHPRVAEVKLKALGVLLPLLLRGVACRVDSLLHVGDLNQLLPISKVASFKLILIAKGLSVVEDDQVSHPRIENLNVAHVVLPVLAAEEDTLQVTR